MSPDPTITPLPSGDKHAPPPTCQPPAECCRQSEHIFASPPRSWVFSTSTFHLLWTMRTGTCRCSHSTHSCKPQKCRANFRPDCDNHESLKPISHYTHQSLQLSVSTTSTVHCDCCSAAVSKAWLVKQLSPVCQSDIST